jgi:hypothetical protein
VDRHIRSNGMNVTALRKEFTVETDLTDEERAIIAEGSKRFKEHPEEFVRLEDFLESQGIPYEDILAAAKGEA